MNAPLQMQEVDRLLKACNFSNWLGVAVDFSNDNPCIAMPFSEQHIGNGMIRAIHGGILASFMEVAAASIIGQKTGQLELPLALNSDVVFLRSTKDCDCFANVTVLRLGKKLATLEVNSWQTDSKRVLATGRFTFLVNGSKN